MLTTALLTRVKMRKLLLPFTVTPLPVMLSMVKGAKGRSGNWFTRVMVNRSVVLLYPGSLRGMLKLMVFAAALAVASMIACRKLPAPASAVVETIRVAAWTLCEANTSKLSNNVAKAMPETRIRDRIDVSPGVEAKSLSDAFHVCTLSEPKHCRSEAFPPYASNRRQRGERNQRGLLVRCFGLLRLSF